MAGRDISSLPTPRPTIGAPTRLFRTRRPAPPRTTRLRSRTLRAAAALGGLLGLSALDPAAGQSREPEPASVPVHIVHLTQGERYRSILDGSRFRFEPWGGALWDAYRNSGGNERPAWIGAVRFGYDLGAAYASGQPAWRLIAEVARAEAAEAGTAVLPDSSVVGFRTEWWLATAGAEWDVLAGWIGLTLEAHGGAAWIQREIVGGDSITPGEPGTTERAESEPFPALVLGVSGYRHLTHRVQIRARLEDVITDPFDGLEHSPALGLGFRFVFE